MNADHTPAPWRPYSTTTANYVVCSRCGTEQRAGAGWRWRYLREDEGVRDRAGDGGAVPSVRDLTTIVARPNISPT
jgi:hypothetical protein